VSEEISRARSGRPADEYLTKSGCVSEIAGKEGKERENGCSIPDEVWVCEEISLQLLCFLYVVVEIRK